MDWEPRVGMRVVCVDDAPHGPARYDVLPTKGTVYTISGIATRWDWSNGVGFGVHIAELKRPIGGDGRVHPWGVTRFRPLDERRLDIFRAVLTKAPTPEKEPA